MSVSQWWWVGLIGLLGWAGAAAPQELDLHGEPVQGGLLFGQAAPATEVRLDGRELRLTAEGRFVFGFGRDAPLHAELEARLPDGRLLRRTLAVAAREYDIQRIDGLPPAQVTPRTPEQIARIEADAQLLNDARARNSALLGFTEPVVWPVTGRISGVYGSQRILNGEPRAPHRGVDVAAPPGTPVGAMASGVVSLAEADMYFTGGTVMIDHGHGVHSIYSHLAEVQVAPGQLIGQGEILGTVGATGRATGPHLHWGVYWFGEAVDPALLVGPMPAS